MARFRLFAEKLAILVATPLPPSPTTVFTSWLLSCVRVRGGPQEMGMLGFLFYEIKKERTGIPIPVLFPSFIRL